LLLAREKNIALPIFYHQTTCVPNLFELAYVLALAKIDLQPSKL
jgi:hypothetical protein